MRCFALIHTVKVLVLPGIVLAHNSVWQNMFWHCVGTAHPRVESCWEGSVGETSCFARGVEVYGHRNLLRTPSKSTLNKTKEQL